MIEIRTGSRLHFGLLNPGSVAPGERRFGGAGLMIDRPGVSLAVEPAASWNASGPLAERALAFAHRFAQALLVATGTCLAPHHINVIATPPDHVGLGTGTQLGMAVARALSLAIGRGDLAAPQLAAMVGRGARSAIGVHGFFEGGFLVDGGLVESTSVAPVIARLPIPDNWRILLLVPDSQGCWHGRHEQSAFESLVDDSSDTRRCDRLCRLLMLTILPALAEGDLPSFGAALHEFNVLAGEPFAMRQGGRFSSPQAEQAVALLRRLGVSGVGQSSWGPTIFAIADAEHATWVQGEIGREPGRSECLLAQGRNVGTV